MRFSPYNTVIRRTKLLALFIGLALFALVLAACNSALSATPTPGPTSSPTSPPAATEAQPTATNLAPNVTPTSQPTTTPVNRGGVPIYSDPTAMMMTTVDIIMAVSSGVPADAINKDIIVEMGRGGNTSFVPVLLDLLFLAPNSLGPEAWVALTQLTGEDFTQFEYGWTEGALWLGRHQEVVAPEGYPGFKRGLFSFIDPEIARFFPNDVQSRIRLEEIVWGGVRKDGIPDLLDAPVIFANQAAFMNPDDRVFGVSINGEYRAYPHRILNWHEMANDVLGGEPIALAY